MFYEFKNQTDDGRDLFVYGDIVGEKWDEESAETDLRDFRDALSSMRSGQTLNMYINSGGGSVFAASAMVSMVKRAQAGGVVVNAYVDGLAASAASWLALAADNVYIYKNSMMMVHKPISFVFGNANDMAHEIDALNSAEQNVMIPIYMARAKIDRAAVQALIDAESWMGAGEIADAFDVTLLEEEKQVAACASGLFGRYRHTPDNLAHQAQERKLVPIDYSEFESRLNAVKGM